MKKLLAFAAAVLLMTGCQLKTATYADDQAIPLEEGQTDSLIMSVSLEYPVKGAPAEVIDKISHSILTTAFDLEEEPGEVIETAHRLRHGGTPRFRGGDRPPLRGQPQGRILQRV